MRGQRAPQSSAAGVRGHGARRALAWAGCPVLSAAGTSGGWMLGAFSSVFQVDFAVCFTTTSTAVCSNIKGITCL